MNHRTPSRLVAIWLAALLVCLTVSAEARTVVLDIDLATQGPEENRTVPPFLQRCGVRALEAEQREELQALSLEFERMNPSYSQLPGTIEIPVIFHVLHNGSIGRLERSDAERQIDIVNREFAPHDVRFYIADFNRHDNAVWFRMPYNDASDIEEEVKKALGVTPKKYLNIFSPFEGPSRRSSGSPSRW